MAHTVFSRHATIRAQQRGIKPAEIDAVLRYADMEARRGDGWFSTWIRRESPGDFGHRRLRGFRPRLNVSLRCKATMRLASPLPDCRSGASAAAYSCGESAELDGSLGADMLTALREGD